MKGVTVADLLAATGGTLLGGEAQTALEHISLDSRTMEGNDLFIPVIGEKTDGHRYIAGAFAAGAAASLTSRHDKVPEELAAFVQPASGEPPRALIRVDDTVQALQAFGLFLRSRLSMPVVGVTGSVGKTSTREMIACALSGGLSVTQTTGNSNGQLGVPVTLGRLDETADIAVMEMGMSEPGEMARIAAIARPDVAVMINIGVSHIENLGSREAIFREKLHITDGFTEDNTLIVNGDDDWLSTLKGRTRCRLVTYGLGPDNDLRAEDIRSDGQTTAFTLVLRGGTVKKTVRLSVPGEHNVMNALAAVAVSQTAGVDTDAAIAALAGFHGFKRRLQWLDGRDVRILDDSYNASPESTKAAAKVLAETACAGRRVMIFADMLELGETAPRFHREVCDCAAALGLDLLITIGRLAGEGAGASEELRRRNTAYAGFADNAAAKAALPGLLRKGDTVLVKGSNGMHLEEIVRFLQETAL